MANRDKMEVADAVRRAIASVPPLDSTRLDVDETGIYSTQTNGETWWRVPVVPIPWPNRLYPLYEVLAEIEGVLQDEQGLDILLFASEPKESIAAEATLTS